MNVDSLNSNPLLSSIESLKNIQQSIQSDGLAPADFSATLLEKIGQLDGMDGNGFLLENFNLSDDNKLQDVAGLLGNFLPAGNTLNEEFNQDNTLSGFADVTTMLDDTVMEGNELDENLTSLVEELEIIKNDIPEQAELNEGIEQIQEAVLEFQALEESAPKLINNTKLTNNISTAIEDEGLQESLNTVSLNGLNSEINETDNIKLENRIDNLALEIQAIKDSLSEKLPAENNHKKDVHEVEISNEELSGLHVINHPTTVIEPQNEQKKLETVAITPSIQDIKFGNKNDNLIFKQSIEESYLTVSAKTEASNLSQQENPSHKPAPENLFTNNKQKAMIDNLNLKEMDLGNEKSLPRFATDIAMLNRAVITENKVEVPPMTKHFSHPEWNKEMGERVVWMHKQAIPSAELRLNPENLGPIKIKIDVTQDQATVAFTAQHANVKEAIEASLPKLRELFSAQQLNLVDVNVSQNDSGQKQSREFEQMGNGASNSEHRNDNELATSEQSENTMEIVDEIEAGRAIASNGVLSIFA